MWSATFQTQSIELDNVAKESAGSAEHRLALLKDARFLLSLREELDAEEQRLAESRMALAREYLACPEDAQTEEHRDAG